MGSLSTLHTIVWQTRRRPDDELETRAGKQGYLHTLMVCRLSFVSLPALSHDPVMYRHVWFTSGRRQHRLLACTVFTPQCKSETAAENLSHFRTPRHVGMRGQAPRSEATVWRRVAVPGVPYVWMQLAMVVEWARNALARVTCRLLARVRGSSCRSLAVRARRYT